MEHYKSRNNDFFHFTNPQDDFSELDDDDDDDDELRYYDVDDDRSCDFNFHTFHPLGITQSPPRNFQTSGAMNQNDTVIASMEEFGTFDNGALIFQLDNTMKKLSDKLLHTIEGIGTQISRLEDETCNIDKYVKDVKNSEDRYHGITHRKLRQMQSILEEVQDDVLFLRDKHEIAETQLHLAKLQRSKRYKSTPTNPQNLAPLPAPQSSCRTPFAAPLDQPPSNEVTLSPPVFYRPTSSQFPYRIPHEISYVKPFEFPLNPQEQSSRSNYTNTPMARALPLALPTAVDLEGGSSSDENGKSIPVDDVVDKVTAMGFRRDHVRASVRKMIQNGNPVNLNSVLDRMMDKN